AIRLTKLKMRQNLFPANEPSFIHACPPESSIRRHNVTTYKNSRSCAGLKLSTNTRTQFRVQNRNVRGSTGFFQMLVGIASMWCSSPLSIELLEMFGIF